MWLNFGFDITIKISFSLNISRLFQGEICVENQLRAKLSANVYKYIGPEICQN